mgnify:CR=1 FL=1
MKKGKLYLAPNFLGDSSLFNFDENFISLISKIEYFIFENEKVGRSFIKKINPIRDQSSINIRILNKKSDIFKIDEFLNPCQSGFDIALISDAGCPAIADPGSDLISIAHEQNIRVVPLVGPSSILLALMASGMNGQQFKFNGYLPIDKKERKKTIKYLEKKSIFATQIFMETPYRNNQLIEALLKTCNNNTKLCIASDITLTTENIKTKTIAEWKQTKINLHKKPAIFLIG